MKWRPRARIARIAVAGILALVTIAPSAIAVAPDAVEATIAVANNPYTIAIAPNNAFAYVSNFGIARLSRINLTTNTIEATITMPSTGGREIAFTPDSAYAYACSGSNVVKIRTSDNTIVSTIAVTGCWGLAVAPNGTFVYVGALTTILLRINVSTDAVTTISTPNIMYGGSFTPDGAFAYWAENNSGSIAKIRTSDNTIVARISGVPNVFDTAISPDGQFGFASSSATSNSLKRFSTVTDSITATYPLNSTQGMGFTPDGGFLYVSEYGATKVNKVNTATDAVTLVASGTGYMYYLAVAPNGTFALGASYNNNQVVRYFLNNNITSSTLSLASPTLGTYRSSVTITGTLGVSGSDGVVTFYANGKKIPGCIRKASVALSASCTFKPATRGAITVTATLVPTDSLFSRITSKPLTLLVSTRTTRR